MQTAAQSEYLTTAQAAASIGVARDKITDWIQLGDLPAVNVALRQGGKPRWRIRRIDWDAFLARRSSEGAADAK